ncbi:apolipoprotein N-acyltransferase [Methylophaga muralis]|uniref:Apolipoprotein N-acyltransferase n=1 Tax=Methylophaga muralis TaxID=291169 RepID=A0A1E3GVS4_9GAMM|nr:apolipoprotein N-acyltransferase [Methylophaga muralis]ODN68104.1 Apolipoprotein N-acyltransferase [Methylophaga muralis]
MTIPGHKAWQGAFGSWAALVAGAILPLSLSPFHFYPLAIISLLILFMSWQHVTPRQAFWRGSLFGAGMFGVGVSWVYVAIHVFGQASVFLAGLLTALFVVALGLMIGGLGWLLKRLTGPFFSSKDFLILLPIGWLLFEWFKAWFLTGFPWLEVGTGQIEGPLAGFIPLIGVHGASWLVALTAGCLAIVISQRKWPLILLPVVIWGSAYTLQSVDWTQPTGEPLKAALIQGNVPQEIKWDPQQLRNTLQLYADLSRQNWDADIIVWPENAATAFYHQIDEGYLAPLGREARGQNTDIILGLPVLDENGDDYYNSMVSLTETPVFYHKRHLVPFGDYVPFETLRGLIKFFDLPMSAFVPGSVNQPQMTLAGQPVGISICYEDAFSSEVLDTVPVATMLINATNNAWYGDSFAPHQHLQISRSRGLETGRPILRVTTNGISAFIDYKGKIQNQSPQFEQAVLTGEIQPRDGSTPYVRWGQWPLLISTLLLLALWAYYLQLHRRLDQ